MSTLGHVSAQPDATVLQDGAAVLLQAMAGSTVEWTSLRPAWLIPGTADVRIRFGSIARGAGATARR